MQQEAGRIGAARWTVGVTLTISGVLCLIASAFGATANAGPGGPSATFSRFVIGKCKSTDSPSPHPQWHGHYGFRTLSGQPTQSVRPGGLVKFVYRVTGGNVDSFNMEALTEAPIYHFPKAMTILKRGSHPAWSKAGGNPHWVLKDLCHWKVKKTISYLVKVDRDTPPGKRLCMPFDVWARTGSNIEPYGGPIRRECMAVGRGGKARASSSSASASTARLSWTLPHSVSEGQPIAFSWSGGRIGHGRKLVVQRQVGTAHSWKSVLRLRSRSGTAELPGLPLGRYRLRLAEFSRMGRLLVQQVAGLGVFGEVPLGTLLGAREQVYSTSSFTFPYVLSHQIVGDEITALTVERNHCRSVHIAFVPGEGYYSSATGTVSVIQETQAPISASTAKNTLGSLDAALVPGQSWSITETSDDVEPVFFFNGYAVCSSAERFSS